ncbi:MAG: hypothetical protein A3G52_03445 [Candidatus Taylorbacteria bacterium RIFCSPLOWO2_12_FULL_43_20]|uniref:Methyltransferase domain-containing protein n=1 Tax=Candidatus Taylorbacteria bacterium RIFCSPLOWO2_12_FULL_43_20 TaxID=1802332 RepID=A0A1G2P0Q6_9BACT|nr:MAG: hypothetical protein A2825_02390 [Candidatus Taylorbacteria bacterium RIFCSPHIGHO2_01_FULL_43_120]OHA22402.1 MAG: hypothetical protein A3B98_02290 [Candidatus Taylorbacteria bacterium RIFCSPHIGHO2_02_FULL_43_55]OHA28341.1 MAG: hypothetical protein A3E92_00460 [Candidatus Taylorbacteria bacterium RIFCSPHIGHO2_12_FULL_42_34]OHA30615.1 MAG: hypothetical protein A3B09_00340 [Candidatus Taylorbacteria bacterium RIFCSPLOWO2_01_FULL_43_83]OHA38512.1 MAG: hypothetical protein A3H58_02985 [Candi
MKIKEIKKREKYAREYDTRKDFDRHFTDFRFRCLKEHFPMLKSVLEVGCANGIMTEKLIKISKALHVVEPSEHYIRETEKNLGSRANKIVFFQSFIEDWKTNNKYDTVVLSSILHEAKDPVSMLKTAKNLLSKNGIIFINVPNALSLHRRIGVSMGMLKNEYEFNERDKKFLHKRNYDMVHLTRDAKNAGLKIVEKGGYFLKPFSNNQMEKFDLRFVEALYEISKEAPADLCAEIYLFAKNNEYN